MVNFEFDKDNGIVRDKLTRERCLVIYKTGLESVFKALGQIFKGGIEVLLLESSRSAGLQLVDSLGKEAKTDIKRSLSAYTKRFVQNGFGKVEICEFERERARMRVRVWNNIFAEMRYGKLTYCDYIAGLFSGIYEGLLHISPKVKELKCIGHGDPYCEFLLTLKTP
jgi:predicted hydrocarbon binding protein